MLEHQEIPHTLPVKANCAPRLGLQTILQINV